MRAFPDFSNVLYEKGGVIHSCKGAVVHPGITLIWTDCGLDVPAMKGFVSDYKAFNCLKCGEK